MKLNYNNFLVKLILSGCDYFPFKSGCKYDMNTNVLTTNVASKYGSVNQIIQTLITCLLQYNYAVVYCFKEMRLRHMHEVGADAELFKMVPEISCGITDVAINLVKQGKAARNALSAYEQ